MNAKEEVKLQRERNKGEALALKSSKYADSRKDKKKKEWDKFKKKVLEKRFTAKKIMEKNEMTVTVTKRKPYSVLDGEGQFFKGEMNKEKRRLFFE